MHPKLLIFDEATSALDCTTEQVIQQTIERLRKHMTIVIIAHRLTTVKSCDQLYWIEKGVVYKKGTAKSILEMYVNS